MAKKNFYVGKSIGGSFTIFNPNSASSGKDQIDKNRSNTNLTNKPAIDNCDGNEYANKIILNENSVLIKDEYADCDWSE